MKKYKKILICLSVVIIFLATIANAVLSQSEYADLIIDGKFDSYILDKNNQKYCFMYCYGYNSDPDIKIRNGKNYFFSLFNENFWAYSDDPERNFIFSEESGFGVQLYGLYIKESALDSLLEPTPENIYRIVVYDENDKEILSFDERNEEIFEYFMEKYSKELSDYFYPMEIFYEEPVFTEDYSIDIEYLNGKISRAFINVNKEEVEKMLSIADINNK